MLKAKNSSIYVMSGWGFSSDIFAHSELVKLPYTPLDYVQAPVVTLRGITHYLVEKIADNSILIAWSLGGLFAINIAYLFPHKVKKIILLASQPKFLSDAEWQGVSQHQAHYFEQTAEKNFDLLVRKFISLVNYPNRAIKNSKILKNSLIAASNKEKLCQLLSILFGTDLRAAYKAVRAPVLNIVNGVDAIVQQDVDCLAALRGNAKTIMINDAGHAGFLTHGQHYLQTIETFINNE